MSAGRVWASFLIPCAAMWAIALAYYLAGQDGAAAALVGIPIAATLNIPLMWLVGRMSMLAKAP